jgi:hypothetical protein
MRASAKNLDWGGPDLALDNLRNLVNFYDQVIAASHQVGIVPDRDAGDVYREGQAVIAALHALDLSTEIIDAYGQVRKAMAIMADGRDEDDIDPRYFAEFTIAALEECAKARRELAGKGGTHGV